MYLCKHNQHMQPMDNNLSYNTSPLLVAGPCSIENLQQLRRATQQLMEESPLPVEWIRGGVWKPRTRPGGFEGLGIEALNIIEQVKQEYPKAKFCCEVACAEHVEAALAHHIDGVWIGSRTTGNPFSVEEICQALKGTAVPVWVKNPLTPDVKLWMGAVERVMQTGSQQVSAVHRGFTPYHHTPYRNNPMWEIPMELRRLMPEISILCDPSHIGGKGELIGELMQTAMDLHFDGLMVEVHPSPSQALTDARQQLDPEVFFSLLKDLKLHQDSDNTPNELSLLRKQIDMVDQQIMELLANRLELAREIASVKEANNMAIYQPKRWEEVLERKMEMAVQAGMDPQFIKEIYEKIHAESVRTQLKK